LPSKCRSPGRSGGGSPCVLTLTARCARRSAASLFGGHLRGDFLHFEEGYFQAPNNIEHELIVVGGQVSARAFDEVIEDVNNRTGPLQVQKRLTRNGILGPA